MVHVELAWHLQLVERTEKFVLFGVDSAPNSSRIWKINNTVQLSLIRIDVCLCLQINVYQLWFCYSVHKQNDIARLSLLVYVFAYIQTHINWLAFIYCVRGTRQDRFMTHNCISQTEFHMLEVPRMNSVREILCLCM
jgi:hypothetical protein